MGPGTVEQFQSSEVDFPAQRLYCFYFPTRRLIWGWCTSFVFGDSSPDSTMGIKSDNDSVPQVVAAAYDGSSVLFKALRACGWGPLLNLGYYPLWNPASWLDVPGSQVSYRRKSRLSC